ncbi:hypothetical protein D7Y13_10460 [Corallococcus praedator]|uniref:Uncharacterized protein n=1 Tax=Corallococcus praedator TaxID=2316724 RepID=A0ABX9QLC2_9BACT|nr:MULTISPECIES: OTU domain-containing protein [Corallococcus]RKH32103.1 hypothetical protein D7X75_17080 [Corallococcus sp. CA031C]RKI11825.1 hypothetical protein D7Y13_10460 [Corallococcus praedator]
MPCEQHEASNDSCFECIAVDVATFAFEVPNKKVATLRANLIGLTKRVARVTASELDEESLAHLERLIAEANGAIRKHAEAGPKDVLSLKDGNSGFVVPLDPGQFTPLTRSAYRHFVGRTGSWLGLSEIQVLAKRFYVSFEVYFESTGDFYDIEAMQSRDCIIRGHCLVFTGNHWEVGVVVNRAVTARIATNPLGDCSLEAFLTLLAITNPVVPARLARRLWHWVDEYRLLRNTHCLDGQFNDAVPADKAVVVTDKIRDFLRRGMGEHEINDALMAVPGLRLKSGPSPSSTAPSKGVVKSTLSSTGGRWGDYVAHVTKYFKLTQSLVCQTTADNSFTLVTNISQIDAASLLKKHGGDVATVLGLSSKLGERVYRPANLEDGAKKYPAARLTHIGFMVAKIERTDSKTAYFMCLIANFAVGRITEKHPYMTTGVALAQKAAAIPKLAESKSASEAELFSAADMHTECYSLFMLDRLIHGVIGASLVKSVEVEFILQLDMCHRCRQATTYFQQNHSACQEVTPSSAQSGDQMDGEIAQDVAALLKRPPVMKAWDPFAS